MPPMILPTEKYGEDGQAMGWFVRGEIEDCLFLRHLPQARHQILAQRALEGRAAEAFHRGVNLLQTLGGPVMCLIRRMAEANM